MCYIWGCELIKTGLEINWSQEPKTTLNSPALPQISAGSPKMYILVSIYSIYNPSNAEATFQSTRMQRSL